tara:strand:- start:37 stop:570 length:534 start_codon:yes stop_codon:yes gene_type:complete
MLCEKFDNIRWGSPEAKQFAEYWRSLEPENMVPKRRSFDPTRIANLLPAVAIYEILSSDEIIYRLAGTAIVDRLGIEVTGKNFLDFWPGEQRAMAASAMMECVTRPCGILSKIVGISDKGIIERNVSIGFPMCDDNGECRRMLFFTSDMQGQQTRIPREDQIRRFEAPKNLFIDLTR